MKNLVLAAGIACIALPALAKPVFNAPADIAAIKALEQQNASSLDAKAVAQNYAQHAIILDYTAGSIYRGRPQIEKSIGAVLAPIKSLTASLPEQSIFSDGSFACDLYTSSFQYTTKTGASGSLNLRQMDALEKIHGRWQVVQEQNAVLKDPKSDTPVTQNFALRGDMAWPAAMQDFQIVPPAQAKKEILNWTDYTFNAVGIAAVMPSYGPDADELAMYAPTTPGNIRGLKEMYAYYAPSMNAFKSLVVKTPILDIATDGILGSEISVQLITLHLHNGKSEPLYWRQSDCVHRVGGKWYGFEDMSSFPLDPKTGKMLTESTFLVPEN